MAKRRGRWEGEATATGNRETRMLGRSRPIRLLNHWRRGPKATTPPRGSLKPSRGAWAEPHPVVPHRDADEAVFNMPSGNLTSMPQPITDQQRASLVHQFLRSSTAQAILEHLRLPSKPLPLAPATSPPQLGFW